MTPGTSRNRSEQSLSESFERYLQDKGKGRGGDGGNYRRNAARKLERFAEWAASDRGADDWTGIVSNKAAGSGWLSPSAGSVANSALLPEALLRIIHNS